MAIFCFYTVFCLLWWRSTGFSVKKAEQYEQRKKQFLIIGISVFLVIIIGLRHYMIGADTESYVEYFEDNKLTLLDFFKEFTFAKYPEPLHDILVILVRSITGNYSVYLLIAAALFTLAVGVLVYRYSETPRISYIALLSIGYVYFSMAALRQVIAMAILLFAYKYVRERKLLPFLLLVLLACGFHNTAIVFLIIYPIAYLKVTWKHFAVLGVGFGIVVVGREAFKNVLFQIVQWERFSGYEAYESSVNLSGFIIQLAIITFSMFYYRQLLQKEPQSITLYNVSFVGAFFKLLTPLIGEFFRFGMYFGIFDIILIANICQLEKGNVSKRVLAFIVGSVLILYFVLFSGNDATIIPYKFA